MFWVWWRASRSRDIIVVAEVGADIRKKRVHFIFNGGSVRAPIMLFDHRWISHPVRDELIHNAAERAPIARLKLCFGLIEEGSSRNLFLAIFESHKIPLAGSFG